MACVGYIRNAISKNTITNPTNDAAFFALCITLTSESASAHWNSGKNYTHLNELLNSINGLNVCGLVAALGEAYGFFGGTDQRTGLVAAFFEFAQRG